MTTAATDTNRKRSIYDKWGNRLNILMYMYGTYWTTVLYYTLSFVCLLAQKHPLVAIYQWHVNTQILCIKLHSWHEFHHGETHAWNKNLHLKLNEKLLFISVFMLGMEFYVMKPILGIKFSIFNNLKKFTSRVFLCLEWISIQKNG